MAIPAADAKNASITLRPYRSADLQALYELDRLCFRPPFRFSRRAIERFAAAPGALTILAEMAGGPIAGFLIAQHKVSPSESAGYIVTLDVHPDMVRSGIATRLMVRAERDLAERGAEKMRLHVFAGNTAAIAFYEQLDFRRIKHLQDFYGANLDAYVYERDTLKDGGGRERL